MTTLGGIGHTLPYLIPSFKTATSRRRVRGAGGTGHHLLGSAPVHGHAAGIGRAASRAGRRAGFSGGNFDWEFVNHPRRLAMGLIRLEPRLRSRLKAEPDHLFRLHEMRGLRSCETPVM